MISPNPTVCGVVARRRFNRDGKGPLVVAEWLCAVGDVFFWVRRRGGAAVMPWPEAETMAKRLHGLPMQRGVRRRVAAGAGVEGLLNAEGARRNQAILERMHLD